jgi:uncharacterized glyoxalase superfamily protein PhnB
VRGLILLGRARCAGPKGVVLTSIQPELWVESPSEAVAFYEAAFGATVLHRVGDGDDIDPFGHEWEIGAPLGAWPPN